MDAVEIAASCTLPPVLSKSAVHASKDEGKMLRSQYLKTETLGHAAVAPYQALPVAGPVITHHKSTALPVLEPHPEMSDEVRGEHAVARVIVLCGCPAD